MQPNAPPPGPNAPAPGPNRLPARSGSSLAGPDVFADLYFPVGGLDVAHSLDLQPPKTSPGAMNVRSFEPATNRLRGGSRAGLAKYMANAIPTGPGRTTYPHLIQHLAYVVDPQGKAHLHFIDYQLGVINVDFWLDPTLPDEFTDF